MNTWFPTPRLSLALGGLWLLLNESLSPGNLLIAALVAIVIPRVARPMLPPPPVVHRPLQFVGYLLLVLGDIVTSAFRVAGLVLGPARRWKPCLVSVPLDVSDPVVVAALAATVSLTPGTLSVRVDPSQGRLDVHALGVDDPALVVRQIKERYERRLKEIFRC